MTKLAHIATRPGHEVGDRVLGLCGKAFTVKVLWAEIPDDKPICRSCVDRALKALTQADDIIEMARLDHKMMEHRVARAGEVLHAELILDSIALDDADHEEKRIEKLAAREELEQAKKTCTCTWTSQEVFEVDPACPIHGGELDAIAVEIEEP